MTITNNTKYQFIQAGYIVTEPYFGGILGAGATIDDPPLIDVYVKGGFRKGDVNPAEAIAVVDEIEAIIADPSMVGRSIGVVTLMGMEQAAYIHELVSKRISPADVLARKIVVGAAPMFQGRERDIMMVSMVLGPTDHATQNKADMQQRYNVALSRARDRTYPFIREDRAISHAPFAVGAAPRLAVNPSAAMPAATPLQIARGPPNNRRLALTSIKMLESSANVTCGERARFFDSSTAWPMRASTTASRRCRPVAAGVQSATTLATLCSAVPHLAERARSSR